MPAPLTSFRHDGFVFDLTDSGSTDRPVLIALHGFPQRGSSWDGVVGPLVAGGYRVLVPDQRGYSPGARPQNVSAYRLDRLAGDVLALADAAGAATFHVLGHDWGAGVAWYLASRHADRVGTLTAVSTPHPRALLAALPRGQALQSWYMGLFQVPWLPEYLLRASDGALARRLLAGAGAPDPEESVRLLADPAAATAMINWYRALRLPGAPGPGKVAIPTLYVWSDGDAALGRRAASLTANWVTGPYSFVILPGVSHWIPEERPAELADLVLAHLAAHGGHEVAA